MSELVASPDSAPPAPLGAGTPLERLRGLSGQPLVKRAMPWFLGAAALGGVALTWSVLSPAPQRILYSELGDNERAGVVSSLDKAGIAYRIDNNTGTLTVAEDDLYRARMLVVQFCEVAGGPCRREGKSMAKVHEGQDITRRDFNALVEVLQQAMDAQGIAFRAQNRMLALLAPMHREIVNKH